MATDDLRAFIEARLAEDAAIARGTHGQGEWNEGSAWLADMVHPMQSQRMERPDWIPMATVGDIRHIARHDPARVLREVAAKRAILAAVDKYLDPHPGLPCTNEDDPYDSCELHTAATGRVSPDVLPLLATAWQDHPDYHTSWSTA